tara:strand:- start:246 stop:869 length:624 start_codon:yes stop_codon:yes gene_type:complete
MNKIYKIFIIFPFLILGCKSNLIEDTKFIQKINSLDMNIFSNEGEKIYSIKSPNTSYNKEKNIFNLEKTTIKLFKDEVLEFIIKSNESKLYDNNKIIELKGNVELRSINQDNDVLYADNFIWNVDETNYLLKGNVIFENDTIILSSSKATLNSENIIEFFNPVKYIIKNQSNEKSYEINSENAYYNIDKKSVNFSSKDKRVRSKIYF